MDRAQPRGKRSWTWCSGDVGLANHPEGGIIRRPLGWTGASGHARALHEWKGYSHFSLPFTAASISWWGVYGALSGTA
jgi:hypothetical protein